MKRSLAIALLLLAASCSSDYDQPPQQPPMRGGGGMGMGARARAVATGLEVLPPTDWWHDEAIARAVNLTGDQLAQLDKISADQSGEIARLERDGMVAIRDLRTALESAQPTNDGLTSAGHRVREMRAALLDRQVQLLASERLVLSQQQWQTLQERLQEQRRETPRDRGTMRGGRGRGGMGGGRRPIG